MKFRIWWALARGVLLESLRRKELWVVGILGFLVMAASSALGFFGMEGLESFAKDLATNVLGAFGTVIAVVVASRSVPDEIRNRTLYPLLARPISRFDFLFGKLIGAILATWIGFSVLLVLTCGSLAMFHVTFEPVMLQYLFAKLLGLALLCTVSLTLSCFMTPAAALTLSFVLAFGSGMMTRAFTLAYETANPGTQMVFKFMNAVLPQYGMFDLGSRVSGIGWGMVPMWVVGAMVAYFFVYGGGLMTLSWLRFRRQAL